MSVRQGAASNAPTAAAAAVMDITEQAQSADAALAEGQNFAVASPEHPLKRNVVVSIKASLNDLCLQKQRGTWAPSAEALRSIFQQKKFTSLDGAAENQGASPSRSKGWTAAAGCARHSSLPRRPRRPHARARPLGELTLCVP